MMRAAYTAISCFGVMLDDAPSPDWRESNVNTDIEQVRIEEKLYTLP
jgi:hypothetical protein